MVRPLLLLPLVLAALPGRATSEACSPGVVLSGDADVTGPIADMLAARAIATAPTECGAIHGHVTQRAGDLVIDLDRADGTTVQRVAGDAQTAATVIESFAYVDDADPLLERRALPSEPAPELPRPSVAAVVSPLRRARGVQLFSAFETSYASDRTSWLGAHIGVCIMLGPVCAAARLRLAGVATAPEAWSEIERRGSELLVGIDIPIAIRGMTFSPGFAAGIGHMITRTAVEDTMLETGGLRADVHATLSIPLASRLALDVFSAIDLTQQTQIDQSRMMMAFPDEPRALLRLGLGLRYGGL